MKKQYFIFLAITSMVMFNVNAQNTPIDDILKKYPSMEGVTHVSISQEMLQGIFKPIEIPSTSPSASSSTIMPSVIDDRGRAVITAYGLMQMKTPEAYSSVTISLKGIPDKLFNDFKKTLLSSKYETYMEMNSENKNILAYYLKKVNDKTNEIVVLRKQNDHFSAIYVKGEIEIGQVDNYLRIIKSTLDRQMRTSQNGMIIPGNQFAYTMPSSFDDATRIYNRKDFDLKDYFNYDSESFKQRMEESKQRMEESVKWFNEKIQSEDFQRIIQDATENMKKQIEEIKQAEEK